MMARSDDDSWDITGSVGATALAVAAARAADTESAEPLIQDPFARVFLDTAGDGSWNMFSNSALPTDVIRDNPDLPVYRKAMTDYMACRTAFYDDIFLRAADGGVGQAVILAAGLDARAWRLPWPAGTVVYELDQPKVLEFKTSALQRRGAEPKAIHVNVPVDLRQDWPTALQEAGFDVSAPSVWSAEGLLPYLPARGQDLLFERLHALASAGSWIAVEAVGRDFLDPDRLARRRAQLQRYRAALAKAQGLEVRDVEDLWYLEQRTDVAEWLVDHGWDVTVKTAAQLMSQYDRHVSPSVADATPHSLFIAGRRGREQHR